MSRRQPRTTKAWDAKNIVLPQPSVSSRGSNRMASTGANFGAILNYKREQGINDKAKGAFREWTGVPKTERTKIVQQKIPGATPHGQFIQEHRRPTVEPTMPMTADSIFTRNTIDHIASSME